VEEAENYKACSILKDVATVSSAGTELISTLPNRGGINAMILNQCRSCKANIGWIKTKAGKNMPVDPTLIRVLPRPGGEVTIVTEKGEVVKGYRVATDEPFALEELLYEGYISHFATCKYASQHRRR